MNIYTETHTVLLDYLKELPVMCNPHASLPAAEVDHIKMMLTDGCPGMWRYICLGERHIFDRAGRDTIVDVSVQVEGYGDERTFELNVDTLCHSMISLRKFDSPFEAAKTARPFVERGAEMVDELKGMA